MTRKIIKISYVNKRDALDEAIQTLSKRSKNMNSVELFEFYKSLNKSLERKQTCDYNHQTEINEYQRLWKILTS